MARWQASLLETLLSCRPSKAQAGALEASPTVLGISGFSITWQGLSVAFSLDLRHSKRMYPPTLLLGMLVAYLFEKERVGVALQ